MDHLLEYEEFKNSKIDEEYQKYNDEELLDMIVSNARSLRRKYPAMDRDTSIIKAKKELSKELKIPFKKLPLIKADNNIGDKIRDFL